jgi:hypothetical protein
MNTSWNRTVESPAGLSMSYAQKDQEKFDKYVPFVEEMANSIKISKPNFEGINC